VGGCKSLFDQMIPCKSFLLSLVFTYTLAVKSFLFCFSHFVKAVSIYPVSLYSYDQVLFLSILALQHEALLGGNIWYSTHIT
jgi:hypothetical protein